MKNITFLSLLFLSFAGFAQAGEMTQVDMTAEAGQQYLKAIDTLNAVYATILQEHNDDTLFIKNLKASQRLWVEFCDAEFEVKYPQYGGSYYGSSYPMCRYFYLKELTEERTKKLRVWVDGIEEGDVCAGTVKNKN